MRLRLLAPLLALVLAGATAPGWPWHAPQGLMPPLVPADNVITAARVELGRRLFYDADLSINGTLSCASCHEQRHGFADSVSARPGANGERGRRNAPGLANAAWLTPLTQADPGLHTLESQAAVPVFGTEPVEMGMNGHEADLFARLQRDDCYRTQFRKAFPEVRGRIGFDTVAKALASFQRTLVSFGSAYDRGQLSAAARAGQAVFARDCAGCHAGPLFTDLAYHRVGPETAGDLGLIEKTGKPEDRGRFRTPSLRNVALSAPYWHDGSAATLAEAIERHGPGHDTAGLTAFLDSLSDSEFVTRKDLSMPDMACGKML